MRVYLYTRLAIVFMWLVGHLLNAANKLEQAEKRIGGVA